MKKLFCVTLIVLLGILPMICASAGGPSNADILNEYKSLVIGEWERVGDYVGTGPFPYVSSSLSFSEDKYGSQWTLLVSSTNTVYIACEASKYSMHVPENILILSFNEDASYMMLYREGVGGLLYQRAE